jgi:predicted CXXCH cytochrome family protein
MTRTPSITLILTLFGFVLLGLAYLIIPQPIITNAQQTNTEPTGNNSFCLTCHVDSDQTKTLPDGTELSVDVNFDELDESVHGSSSEDGALGCVDCHGVDSFPHDDPYPETGRAYTVQNSLTCTNCHTEQTEDIVDDVHYLAITDGNLRSASCVDCHGAHDIQSPTESIANTAENCGTCHTTTFDKYKDSVHGVTLFEGDENVPTCVTCHGVHGIQHPTTALFRNRSPQLCATCHADEEAMQEYDISTNVFDTYLSDFHGTTVSLFDQSDPTIPSNKAVCFDCHGVHDITKADDTKSQVVRENLLATCRECHPNASSEFPDTWVGHFEPTLESHPIIFLVNLFYDIFIPMVLSIFFILIAVDIIGRVRRRFGGGRD